MNGKSRPTDSVLKGEWLPPDIEKVQNPGTPY
jgi:hypothetical protein